MVAMYHVVECGEVVEMYTVQFDRAGLTEIEKIVECDALARDRMLRTHREWKSPTRKLIRVNNDGCPVYDVCKITVY